MTEYGVITQSVVNITVTSSVNTFGTERRFQKNVILSELKGKLELLTGSLSANMKLELFDKENKLVCALDKDEAMFGSYPVEDGMRLHVTDPTAKVGEFEDVSKVQKYEMSVDDYSKRSDGTRHTPGRRMPAPGGATMGNQVGFNCQQEQDHPHKRTEGQTQCEDNTTGVNNAIMKEVNTARIRPMLEYWATTGKNSVKAFKERNKLGRFREIDPEEQKKIEEENTQKEESEKKKMDSMKIGDRCEVRVTGQPTKRGEVKYTGTADFKPGYWIGVQYDEPVGKNNGSVQGKKYFECPPKYGGFVKPENLEVGDFPEEDLGLGDEEEI